MFVTARDMKVDVVLIDTAGRMQDNEPLMRSLAKVTARMMLLGSQVAGLHALSPHAYTITVNHANSSSMC